MIPGRSNSSETILSSGMYRRCRNCEAWEKTSGLFMVCKTCRNTPYCGRECQKSDWARHREECKPGKSTVELVKAFNEWWEPRKESYHPPEGHGLYARIKEPVEETRVHFRPLSEIVMEIKEHNPQFECEGKISLFVIHNGLRVIHIINLME